MAGRRDGGARRRALHAGLSALLWAGTPWPAAAQPGPARGSPLQGGEGQGAWMLGERLPAVPPATAPATPPTIPPADAPPAADTDWERLMPPDWEALREFERLDFGGLSDADPRARAALRKLQQAWKTAPANPAMDDRDIRIAGFVVPLDDGRGPLREFLLVPYFGACIHVPPPPANQVIHVVPERPVDGFLAMDAVRVEGRLRIRRLDSALGSASWTLAARRVERYTGP